MKADEERLVKLYVDLPNHWHSTGESLWARAVGPDLYELDNSPFCAYGLNFRDVVFAQAISPSEKPRILRVERAGGHRTLRFIFADEVERPKRDELLAQLNSLGTSYEGDNYRYFSLDVPPGVDYDSICAQLAAWENDGILEYETCEARLSGSFDDAPAAAKS